MTVKVGDKVRIANERCGHNFQIGEHVIIEEVREYDYKARKLCGQDWWLVVDDEFEEINITTLSTQIRARMEHHMGKGEYVKGIKWAQIAEQVEELENEPQTV